MLSTVQVEFSGNPYSFDVMNIKHEMGRFAHEIVTLELRDRKVTPEVLKDGTPVKTRIKLGNELIREFVGYIHHIRGRENRADSLTTVICIGASHIMDTSRQKVYQNLTVSSIATKVCEDYRFGYDIVPHSRVRDHVHQAGMTDWKFLGYLANSVGYSLYTSGASIHMAPRIQGWVDNQSNAPVFTLRRSGDNQQGTLVEFEGLIGDGLPTPDGMTATPIMSGVDPRTPTRLGGTKSGKQKTTIRSRPVAENFNFFGSRTVINSAAEAEYEADSYQRRNAFPLRAHARVFGDPRIVPDYPVYLKGLSGTYEGFWIVDSVTHVVDSGVYLCHIDLVSDSSGRTVNGAKEPNPNIIDPRVVSAFREQINISLINGRPQVLPNQTVTLTEQPKWIATASRLRT